MNRFICTFVVLVCLVAPVAGQANWSRTPIATAGDVGQYISLAVDSHGVPYVAYGDFTNGDLVFAYSLGGEWIRTVVDHVYPVFITLCLDQAGAPHILYQSLDLAQDCPLRYATFDGSYWQVETVTSFDFPASVCWDAYPSLALDSAGQPHVSFYRPDQSVTAVCMYGHKTTGNWMLEPIEGVYGLDAGGHTDIKMDEYDRPHVVYDKLGYLRYATKPGSTWSIDGLNYPLVYMSLALGGTTPHLVGLDISTNNLEYFIRLGPNNWLMETIDGMKYFAGRPQLILDTSLRPHVIYPAAGTSYITYATKEGIVWHSEPVDASREGKWPSLALDAFNGLRAAYYAADTGDAFYARKTDITGIPTGLPPRCSLQTFPNPANPTVTFTYTVTAVNDVTLAVYDAAGRLVQTLVHEKRQPDVYQYTFQSELPSGVYFARLQVGDEVITSKFVTLK